MKKYQVHTQFTFGGYFVIEADSEADALVVMEGCQLVYPGELQFRLPYAGGVTALNFVKNPAKKIIEVIEYPNPIKG